MRLLYAVLDRSHGELRLTAMRREGRSYVGDASRQGKKHDVFQRDTVDRVE